MIKIKPVEYDNLKCFKNEYEAICPYCGEANFIEAEDYQNADEETFEECGYCGKTFVHVIEYTISFTSEPYENWWLRQEDQAKRMLEYNQHLRRGMNMERLTKRTEHNKVHSHEPTEYGNDQDRTDLLGEYEELGMTPEEIKNLLNANKWIPVDQEEPKYNEHVLLFSKNKDGKEAKTVGYRFYTENENFKHLNGQYSIFDGGTIPDFLVKEYVKAWMPLPEPPTNL